MTAPTGVIFDIEGYSVYDGPGCRTVAFLKGCALKCKWCANPESSTPYPIPMFDVSKCLFGGECAHVCPHGAITIGEGTFEINRSKCTDCTTKECAEVCDTGALRIAGYAIDADALIERLERDRKYWGPKGGITLTGGEPFLQHEFVHHILKTCYEKYIHTAVETSGKVPWQNYEPSLEYIDWIFFDLKHIDPDRHKEGTTKDNHLVLENLRKLASIFPNRLILRTVIIPDYNDSDEYISRFIAFVKSLGREQLEVNILPLHHLAREKYKLLDKEYFSKTLDVPGNDKMEHIQNLFVEQGIDCYTGGDTPF